MGVKQERTWICDVCGGKESAWEYPYGWTKLFFAKQKRFWFMRATAYIKDVDLCMVCNGSHPHTAGREFAVKETLMKLWERWKK